MPGGDGTGPMGAGSMTGRARGFCAGFNTPGYTNPAAGWGYGYFCRRGFSGRGHGHRNMFYATGIPGRAWGQGAFFPQASASPQDDLQGLKSLEDSISRQLDAIRKRISELTES